MDGPYVRGRQDAGAGALKFTPIQIISVAVAMDGVSGAPEFTTILIDCAAGGRTPVVRHSEAGALKFTTILIDCAAGGRTPVVRHSGADVVRISAIQVYYVSI